jgi:hypothetical protein
MGLLLLDELSGLGQDDEFVWNPAVYALQIRRGERPSFTKWHRAAKKYGTGPAWWQTWRGPSAAEVAAAGRRERALRETYGRHTVSPLLMQDALERKERALRTAYRRGLLMPRTVAEREDVERFKSSFVPAYARAPTRADYEAYKRRHREARRKRQIQAWAAKEAERTARIAQNLALSRRNEEMLRRQREQQRAMSLAAAKKAVRKAAGPVTYTTPRPRGGLIVAAAPAAAAAAATTYTSPW